MSLFSIYYFAQQIIKPSDLKIPQTNGTSSSVQSAIQIALGIAGGAALLIVALGAMKYVLSQGNPQETAKAKNTIIYALVGLVVCATAYSIIGFVITRL